jgi:thiamine pyrophosphokinase
LKESPTLSARGGSSALMTKERVILFANGEVKDYPRLASLLRKGDILVAVDGGLRHIKKLGLPPSLLIGDLDSVSAKDVKDLEKQQVPIQRFAVHKDETDLELALLAVAGMNTHTVVMVGATGGRLDHTLGNIHQLLDDKYKSWDIRLEDGDQEMYMIRDSHSLEGNQGDIVSLIPLTETVTGVQTQGLEYPLDDETLSISKTRGISNVMLGNSATIQIRDGILLCIHIRQVNNLIRRLK